MAAKPKNLPSAEQVAEFDGYIRKWQALLNLGDWRIERGKRPAVRAMADVKLDLLARTATYRLGDWAGEAITPTSLEATAVHELLHVMLVELIDAAKAPRNADRIGSAEHRVINVMERLLVPPKG